MSSSSKQKTPESWEHLNYLLPDSQRSHGPRRNALPNKTVPSNLFENSDITEGVVLENKWPRCNFLLFLAPPPQEEEVTDQH
jgi:hypothetical protein